MSGSRAPEGVASSRCVAEAVGKSHGLAAHVLQLRRGPPAPLSGAAPLAASRARLAMRSSREWKVMMARWPPGLSKPTARGMAAASASSSPLTAMRSACRGAAQLQSASQILRGSCHHAGVCSRVMSITSTLLHCLEQCTIETAPEIGAWPGGSAACPARCGRARLAAS